MDAGRLQHRVQVQEFVPVMTLSGDEVPSWVNYGTPVWAAIDPKKSRELVSQNERQSETDTTITVRWSPHMARVRSKWRILFRDLVYDIQGDPIDLDMARDWLEFGCKSGRTDG